MKNLETLRKAHRDFGQHSTVTDAYVSALESEVALLLKTLQELYEATVAEVLTRSKIEVTSNMSRIPQEPDDARPDFWDGADE